MDPRTHELLLTLAKTLVWAALVVLVLTFLGVVQVLAADSLPVFEDFQEQSRGAVAIAALGGGITAAGILAGLGGILRRMLEGPLRPMADGGGRGIRRVGHKGADAVVRGNTIESFESAVEIGVDTIEFDVLRPRSDFPDGADWRRAEAGPAAEIAGREPEPLVVAHDWPDSERRDPSTLAEVLDAFTRPPLDAVEIDLDLKVAGREDEVVAAIRERGLTGRAMVSTMEVGSILAVRELAPELRAGWTYPRVTRAWDRKRWARPFVLGAGAAARRRLPAIAAKRLPQLGVRLMWIYHPLATAGLAAACRKAGVELVAWTVDDLERMRELIAIGVDGICTNDPRMFAQLDLGEAPTPSSPRAAEPLTPGPPA